MPAETRKIVFSTDELQAALVNYALRSEMRLPNANIERVTVGQEEGLNAVLEFSPLEDNNPRVVEFSEAHVAAAIILFCRTQEVPLPRDSRKVVVPEADSVAMMMKFEQDEKMPPRPAVVAQEAREDAESEAAAVSADNQMEEAAQAVRSSVPDD